jgi:hypothetical protein
MSIPRPLRIIWCFRFIFVRNLNIRINKFGFNAESIGDKVDTAVPTTSTQREKSSAPSAPLVYRQKNFLVTRIDSARSDPSAIHSLVDDTQPELAPLSSDSSHLICLTRSKLFFARPRKKTLRLIGKKTAMTNTRATQKRKKKFSNQFLLYFLDIRSTW